MCGADRDKTPGNVLIRTIPLVHLRKVPNTWLSFRWTYRLPSFCTHSSIAFHDGLFRALPCGLFQALLQVPPYGLLPGLSTEDIRIGVSQPRNKKLAEVFHRLRLIESYGTGIRRIFKLYENCPVQPTIEATTNAFKIVLPNMNAASAASDDAPATTGKSTAIITPQMKTVMDYLAEYGEMTDEDLQELLNIKKTRAYLLARQMHENELIDIIGRGVNKKYKLK